MAPRQVLLAIPHNRGILEGISRYLASHERWRLDLVPDWARRVPRAGWADWPGDGVIAQPLTRASLRALCSRPVPVVDVSDEAWGGPAPAVHADNRAIGALAAEHFLRRGFRHFLFCGDLRHPWAAGRWEGFAAALRDAGAGAALGDLGQIAGPHEPVVQRWLTAAPPPLAVLAACDAVARQIARTCVESGLRIPTDVAVLGVDNQSVDYDLDLVPLSSVDPNFVRIGYEAAATLAAWMAGRPPARPEVVVPPAGVVTRQSTDLLAVRDPLVRDALQHIRRRFHEPISVEGVADRVGLSRRTLDRRFEQALGQSPARVILRVRLEEARRLLRDGAITVARVALLAGFRDQRRLDECFRREFGTTPIAYRRQCALR